MYLDNVIIELTRDCNMSCAHCLRGEPVNETISDSILDSFFKQVDNILTLTLTGGEVSLVPDRIDAVIESARKHNTIIQHFYIATNGKLVSNEFLDSVSRLYDYCENNSLSLIQISSDKYHDKIPQENIEKLIQFVDTNFKFTETVLMGTTYRDVAFKEIPNNIAIIKMGRASNFGTRNINLYGYSIESDDSFIVGDVYVNTKGSILPHCDLSFDVQDNSDLIVCNVNDDISAALLQFNKRKINKTNNINILIN